MLEMTSTSSSPLQCNDRGENSQVNLGKSQLALFSLLTLRDKVCLLHGTAYMAAANQTVTACSPILGTLAGCCHKDQFIASFRFMSFFGRSFKNDASTRKTEPSFCCFPREGGRFCGDSPGKRNQNFGVKSHLGLLQKMPNGSPTKFREMPLK